MYWHIFLGPEQAVSAAFKAILRDPTLNTKLCMFAIDEHTVSANGEFSGLISHTCILCDHWCLSL